MSTDSIGATKRLMKLGNLKICQKCNEKTNSLPSQEPNVMFDIASWKLFRTSDGKIDDEFGNEKLQGKKRLKIKFDLGMVTLPHTNETLQIKGHISLVMPWGTIVEQDLKLTNISNCQEMCNQWAESLGIVTKDSKYFKKLQDIGIPVICAVTAPGTKLRNTTAYALLMLTFFILDDIFDNFNDFLNRRLSAFEIFKVIDNFSSIIWGESQPVEQDAANLSGFPKFLPICNLMALLRKEVLALGKPSLETNYFFESFVTYLESCAWETQGWTDATEQDVNATKKFYFHRREITIGLLPALDIICLYKDIHLSIKLRRDPLFKTLQRQICRHVLLLNDIFSLKKEISNGETSNIILIRNKKKPANYCYKRTLEDVSSCIIDIEGIETQLVKKFPNDQDLIEYFEIGRVWMDAHVQWMFLNKRFGENLFNVEISL